MIKHVYILLFTFFSVLLSSEEHIVKMLKLPYLTEKYDFCTKRLLATTPDFKK